jgi:multiple sugar transport system substrate-binding protein
MARWCSLGGYLPPRQSVYDHPQYQKNPFSPAFREHLATYSRGRPSTRKYLEVSNSMQIALSSVAAGDAEPDQALDDALNRLT